MKSQQTWEELQLVEEFTQLEEIDPRFALYRIAIEYIQSEFFIRGGSQIVWLCSV